MIYDKFHAHRIAWDESLMTTMDFKKLPKGWNAQPPGPVSKSIGDEWIRPERSAVLALPSIVVPLERTFLLNPKHRDFAKIKIRILAASLLIRDCVKASRRDVLLHVLPLPDYLGQNGRVEVRPSGGKFCCVSILNAAVSAHG